MTFRVPVGIIGCGEVARRYPPAIDQSAGLELVAVTDVDTRAAASFASDFGVVSVSGFDTLLSLPLELVCICTPNDTHAELARICLDRGYHVLVEHPLALSAAEGEALVAAAAQRDRQLFVMRQRRFLRSVQSLKRFLANKRLGEIGAIVARVSWHRSPRYYAARPWRTRPENGGVVLNQASHFLDILLYLFGEPRSVGGLRGNLRHPIPVEDSFCGQLEFESGLVADFSCTTAAPTGYSSAHLSVTGEQGAAGLAGRAWERLEHTLDSPARTIPGPNGGDHADFLARVSRRLAGEPIEVVSARESIPTLRVVESIYKTATWDSSELRAHFGPIFREATP